VGQRSFKDGHFVKSTVEVFHVMRRIADEEIMIGRIPGPRMR
jgi:hypothetical protein